MLESVVAFDSDDGGAFVVGGLNRSGVIARLDELAERNDFTLAGSGSRMRAAEKQPGSGPERHVNAVYGDAMPFNGSTLVETPDTPARDGVPG